MASSQPGGSVQKSIHRALRRDPRLTDLLGAPNIFDDVRRDADFPYLTVGETIAPDWSIANDDGLEHTVTLHVWCRAGGNKETHAIIGAIHGVLDDAPLPSTGRRRISLRHEFSEARKDPDGETYHGIVRYRAVRATSA